LNEKVLLPALDVSVQIVSINRGTVRLGIQAPPQVSVLREELKARQAEWEAPAAPVLLASAAAARLTRLTQLFGNRLKVAGTGLGQLRRQLEAGNYDDLAVILDKLEEDFQLLTRRLNDEKDSDRRPRALLVEDNINERELLASCLRNQGLDVVTAGDGSTAIDYLSHHHGERDVLLLDMAMPRCDGATVVRTLRRDPAYNGLKIFAVSGHSPDEYNLPRGPAGIDRWVPKPIDPVVLVQEVTRELERPMARLVPR
jgi:carbon storage regulator CsrA